MTGAGENLDPDLLAQLAAVPLAPGRPLLAVDCDEVMVHLSQHMARWLPTVGFRMELTRYQLEGSLFPLGSDDPVPFDRCLELIDRFFEEQTLHQQPVDGAAEALDRLAGEAQVVVLTNVPGHAGDARRRNLAGLGMCYPVVTNSGGKGRALAWLADVTGAPVAFVDDSLKQHESAARRAPEVARIHFVGAGELQRLLPASPAAQHRAEDWTACEAAVREALGL
jgi:hypothetical protein